MASTLTADTVDELKAWRLKLLKAEAAGSVDAAVLCWRKLNWLLDQHWESMNSR